MRTNAPSFWVTKLTNPITASDLSYTVDDRKGLVSPAYIIFDPEDPLKREVVLADGTFTGNTLTSTVLGNRGLVDSADGAQAHDAGTAVWISWVRQHADDLWDAVEGKAADPHSNTGHSTNLVGEAGVIAALTEKVTPHDNDVFVIEDSEAANAPKKVKKSALSSGASAFTDLTDTPGAITANQFVRGNAAGDALEFATVAAGSFIGARAFRGTNQTISNNTLTDVLLTSESFDTDDFHDDATNPNRFTVPAGMGGRYRVTAAVSWVAAASGVRQVLLVLNGTRFARTHGVGADQTHSQVASDVVTAVPGQWIGIQAWQSSGGGLDLQGSADGSNVFCSIEYLGA